MSGTHTIIALDAMGGDLGVKAVIPGAALAFNADPSLRFILVGDEAKIKAELAAYPDLACASQIIHTAKMIAPDDKPSVALRGGRDSSMRLAINAVSEGRAQAVVSSGNTGALMATAKMVLKCLPDIQRPAIASVLPTAKGSVVMLDLGANLQVDSDILVQFAVMGAVFARVVRNVKQPSVGILNVGSEEVKGHEQLRDAYAVLSDIQFPGKFHGFIEGNDIAAGTVDVVVTDGFTGNVALKVAEGVGKLSVLFMKDALKSSWLSRLGALLCLGAFKKLKAQLDPRLYNGGMFLGLDGICVKSHGSADDIGFAQAIKVAADLVKGGFNEKLSTEINAIVGQEEFISHSVSGTP